MAADRVEEWFAQSRYDLDTAEVMFEAGRHFYAVFMCHLSLEKALKGLLHAATGGPPPKTHNLVLLLRRSGAAPPEKIGRFIVSLSEASVATRYPEELRILQERYSRERTQSILNDTRRALEWIEAQR